MSDDNGSGSGGGNGSVWWGITHGSSQKPQPIGRLNAPAFTTSGGAARTGVAVDRPPDRGEVLVSTDRVEGHTDSDFNKIGISNPPRPGDDHPGLFRVRLRFRKDDMGKLSPAERELVAKYGTEIPELDGNRSLFLVIHVPAIDREPPSNNRTWSKMPWEIHWEW